MTTKDKEFSLIDSPWIRVIDPNCKVSEVSVRDVLVNAHKYEALAGETPSQDFALLRILLAVLHTAVERYDKDGNRSELDSEYRIETWQEIWENKKFPEKMIEAYLNEWYERFYLFHPVYPFMQVANMPFEETYDKKGNIQPIRQMDGELSENNNKCRLFANKFGPEKDRMTYSEAARWLIHYQAFSDAAAKKKDKSSQSGGKNVPSWCGQIGCIAAEGNNLFQTLMLNLVLESGNPKIDESPSFPMWERDVFENTEGVKVPVPSNYAQMYTMQCRRIKLVRTGDYVTNFFVTYGDFVDVSEAYGYEPMSLIYSGTKSKPEKALRRHREGIQAWREFPFSVRYGSTKEERPGVAEWVNTLYNKGVINNLGFIRYRTVSAVYGKCFGCISDIYWDEFCVHADIFSDKSAAVQDAIMKEIDLVDKVCGVAVWNLHNDLSVAAGLISAGNNNKDKGDVFKKRFESLRNEYYIRMNEPFKEWLSSIKADPESFDSTEWRNTAREITLDFGEEIVKSYGRKAYVGVRNDEKKHFMSVPLALINFEKYVWGMYGNK